jgi:histidyl-tRNA synthetase
MIDAAESLLCRGMRDLLPADMAIFRRIERAFLDASAAWGYREVRTPTLEHLYLFTSSGTLSPQLLGRVYSFLDWDGWTGERVVLRPDATIPVARLYREHLGGVAKLAYVANIFRFHAGVEQREEWQCGAELIGESWPHGDVELVALAAHVVRDAGIKGARVSLSHTGILRALLEQAGFLPDEQVELYDRLLDGDQSVLREVEARLPALGAALQLLAGGEPGGHGYLDNLRSAFLSGVPGMVRALDELSLIARTASALGLSVEVSVTGARDFEYYTGPLFRLLSGSTTLASGGRYDRLVTDPDGHAVPACGFALHTGAIGALLQVAEQEELPPLCVRPALESAETLAAAVGVTQQLQSCGIGASLVSDSATCRYTLVVDGSPGSARYTLLDASGSEAVRSPAIEQILTALRRG